MSLPYVTLQARERAAHFDAYVSSVDTALRHPRVAAQLGGLANRLLEVNANTFLPNVRAGGLTIPRKYKDIPEATALIPMTDDEADKAGELMHPILEVQWERKGMGEFVVSSITGVRARTADAIRLLEGMPEETDGHASLAANTTARTSINCTPKQDKTGKYYSVSRPVVAVKSSQLYGADRWNTAATIAHEQLHGADMAESTLTYTTIHAQIGSELAAYHVSNAIHAMSPQHTPTRAFSERVALWSQENMPANAPFAPRDEQVNDLLWLL